MTLLRDLTRFHWDLAADDNPWFEPFDKLPESQQREVEGDARKFLLRLAEAQLSPIVFLKVGMALGQLLRDNPRARPGDIFAAQWRAALLAIAEEADERMDETDNSLGGDGALGDLHSRADPDLPSE